MCLDVEGHFVGMTKMDEGYTWKVGLYYIWRSLRKCDQKAYKSHVEHCKNSNLKFIEILSTPWHAAMDQDWRSQLHALKCAR